MATLPEDKILERADTLQVDGEEGLAQAVALLRQADSAIAMVADYAKDSYDTYTARNAVKNSMLADPTQAREVIRNKIREYLVENEVTCDDFYIRESWDVEVLDLMELVHMVANGNAPLDLLQLNTKFAKKAVGTLKGDMSYDGIKPIPDTVLVKHAKRDSG